MLLGEKQCFPLHCVGRICIVPEFLAEEGGYIMFFCIYKGKNILAFEIFAVVKNSPPHVYYNPLTHPYEPEKPSRYSGGF